MFSEATEGAAPVRQIAAQLSDVVMTCGPNGLAAAVILLDVALSVTGADPRRCQEQRCGKGDHVLHVRLRFAV
jgi:hypothetical protein